MRPPYTHAHAHPLPKPPSSFLSSVILQIPMFFKRYFLPTCTSPLPHLKRPPLIQASILHSPTEPPGSGSILWGIPNLSPQTPTRHCPQVPPGAGWCGPPWGAKAQLWPESYFPHRPLINPLTKWSRPQLHLNQAGMAAMANGEAIHHDSKKNNNSNQNGDTLRVTQDKCGPDEITYLFTLFPLTLGPPGLVWLGTVYELKDQLFNLWEKNRAAILRY